MNDFEPAPVRIFRMMGCLSIAIAMLFFCLMPFLLVEVMQQALARLHLSPQMATLAVLGIFIGSLFNIPVHRIEREHVQPVGARSVFDLWGINPPAVRMTNVTVIAVNVGGCIIPAALAAWQIIHLINGGSPHLARLALIAGANIAACYWIARPVKGIGIMMPGFASPALAVGLTWLLLPADAIERAPIAYVAGIAGPLIGADLLHLKDIGRISTGMLSIGGAGTFDGIVLSGVLAALLA